MTGKKTHWRPRPNAETFWTQTATRWRQHARSIHLRDPSLIGGQQAWWPMPSRHCCRWSEAIYASA